MPDTDDANPMAYHQQQADERLVRKLAGRFRIVNIAWIVLSILLVGTVVGTIAAAWNIYVISQRWKVPAMIEARDPRVPSLFGNDTGWYVTMLVVNVALGGFVGALLIGYEYFFLRSEVLANRHLFSGLPR
jgi:hypothetical protein